MGRRTEGWKLHRVEGSPFYTVRFTHNGRRYHRSTRCTTKREAATAAAKIYADVVGSPPSGASIDGHGDLEDLLSTWLVEVEERKSAGWHASLELYSSTHWLSRWSRLEDLTSDSIQRYISERLRAPGTKGRKLSPVTLAKELSGLSSFLKWCKRRKYLAELPRWDAPEAISDYEAPYLTSADMDLVLMCMHTRETHPKRHPIREYFTVMWATSFRRGTMSRLRWSDVDLHARTITVRPSADKKRNGRVIPLSDRAAVALDSLAPGVGLVFGHRDYRTSLRESAALAGVSGAHRLGTHAVRHGRLTDLAERTQNIAGIQHMAGHKDLASTMRYVHGSLDNARAMLTDLGDSGQDSGQEKAGSVSEAGQVLDAKGGTRTPTTFRPLEPESSASANSATFAAFQQAHR